MNITYLFGAGASYKAVPLVKEIPKEIQFYIETIRKRDESAELLKTLIWLEKESSKFGSIDDYANSLYNHDPTKFKKLKAAMCCFFTYVQLKNNVNPRYHSFLHLIKSKISSQPSNIKILSWNYDFQFEKAYHQLFAMDEGLDSIQRKLNVIPSNSHENIAFNSNKFAICKLNGTALSFERNGKIFALIDDFKGEINGAIIEELNNQYLNLTKGIYTPLLRFAFETKYEDGTNSLYKGAAKATLDAICNTDILVVIGYSFPDYNRSKDKEILEAMPNIKKVFIQAPNDDVEDYIDRFSSLLADERLSNITIEPKRYLTRFFSPRELA